MAEQVAIFVKFVIDTDARFEECNGQPRPLTEREYAENVYRACPVHPRGDKSADKTENGRTWCARCGAEYADVPYAEYRAYYGNPKKHVYLGCIAAHGCQCCGRVYEHRPDASLWGIDYMTDDPLLDEIPMDTWIPEAAAVAVKGYVGEVAKEQVDELRRMIDGD